MLLSNDPCRGLLDTVKPVKPSEVVATVGDLLGLYT